jgi:predicted small secreted protein
MFYKKGLDITNAKQMFEFLRGHYMYDTMNSWNGLKSIANNVKLYNLNLDGDWTVALSFLYDNDGYSDLVYLINDTIEMWEEEHEGYVVGFNGRSGGYLVLYSNFNNSNILPDMITDYDTYEEFKEACQSYYGGVKYYKSDLQYYTKLVQDFDKLCDELRNIVNEYSKMDYKVYKEARDLELEDIV